MNDRQILLDQLERMFALADEIVERIASEGFSVEDSRNILEAARNRIEKGVRTCAVASLPIDRPSQTDDRSSQGTART